MDENTHVLIVDDQLDSLLVLEELLAEHYVVHSARDGAEALDFLESGGRADIIVSDVLMPQVDGFQLCRRLKANPRNRDIPVLFLSSLDSATDEELGLSLGAEDFIHKPFTPPVVLARVRNHLRLARATRDLRLRNVDLEKAVSERTREIMRQSEELVRRKQEVIAAQSATITAFCSLAEARDNETGNHIRRTQQYVYALASELRDHRRFQGLFSDEVIQLLFKSAPLHDVGKVAIPDAILLKPGKLSPEEWVVMQRHCEYGRNAIIQAEAELKCGPDDLSCRDGSFLRHAAEIAYGHHEWWDGKGYPLKISGDAIPVSARLMAVADVYDALISKRVYKPAFSHEQAVEMMVEERGSHFDPDMLDAMRTISDHFYVIARRFHDDDQLGTL